MLLFLDPFAPDERSVRLDLLNRRRRCSSRGGYILLHSCR